jgi:hypothetical protein
LYILVAFTAAKSEEPGIIADEGDAFTGIAGLGAEVACLNPETISV